MCAWVYAAQLAAAMHHSCNVTARPQVLEKARREGDYLLVGVHSDESVTARRGPHLPILSVHERCLSVLACKHVDEVIIGARLP